MKRYELVEADNNKLDEFYEGSSLTFVGCTTDKDNIDFLYNWLKKENTIKDVDNTLSIYTYKGKLMNEKYSLTNSNKYSDDLTFITIMLEDINFENIIIKRLELGGRWFDDIVENNRRREEMN